MATFAEWQEEKKKKKKSTENTTFSQYTRSVLGDDVEINEIGPVKETKKKEESTWFKSGDKESVANTALGSGSDLLENFGAGILGIGEKVIDSLLYVAPLITQGQYYQNGGGFNPEVDKMFEETIAQSKKENQEFIDKDLYDEKAIARELLSNVPSALYMSNIAESGQFATQQDWQKAQQMQSAAKDYLDNDMEKASVFGEKSDALAQSAGQLGATVGLQMVGVPWWLTTGATSFGSEVENAFNQGATYEEAGLSAAITTGAEILTEKISGGIKFGGKTLDEAATKQLSRVITNKVARTLSKVGMDVVGEGGEEVLSGYLSAIGQKLTYADEKELNELFSSEDALDSFIGGAILGGASSGGNAISDSVKGNDYASGLTNSEKAVVDKVYDVAVAEREADGKKLTQREKTKLYDEAVNALEKGYIDTDTIESVVGGETYSSLKAITEQETASKSEYDALYQMKNGEKSDAQVDRQAELKKYLEDAATKKAQLRESLDGMVSEFVKDNKLSEVYNEQERKKQVFEADLTKYDSKQAEVVKKAVESGILNNTNKTHDFVDMIARVYAEKGVSFNFTDNQRLKESGFAVEGATVNGYVDGKDITLNIDSQKALNTVVGHEITHVLEGTELYSELQKVIKEYAEIKGDYSKRLEAIRKLYEGVEGANIEAEITADLVGDYLFTDSDFISKLSAEKPNIFKRIFEEIKYLYKVATAGSKEAKQLEKVKRAFEKAYRDSTGNTKNADTKYSLVGKENGIEVYETSEATKNLSYKERKKMLLDKMKNEFAGRTAKFTKNGEVYYAFYDNSGLNKGVHGDNKSDKKGYKAKINIGADGNYIELAENALYQNSSEESGKDNRFHSDAKTWDYFVKTIKSDGNYFDVLINIKDTGNDQYVYDITLKEATSLPDSQGSYDGSLVASDNSISQNSENASTKNGTALNEGVQYSNISDSVESTIPQKESDVNTKFSLSKDSEGNQLTKEQQEYFKDSKIRDENGNLIVVYHGTKNADFTVFNRNHNYFTDSKEMADSYAPTSEKYTGYLNMKNPFVIDAKGDKWSGIAVDDEVVQMLRESGSSVFKERGAWRTTPADIVSAIEEGIDDGRFDYDGVIIRNVDDTGSYHKGTDNVVGNDYIVFNSNQFKNRDNTAPTSDKDIRYSLSGENNLQDVHGFKIKQGAEVNEDLLEELSIHHPEAQVDADGNVTVYHRTTKENADNIRKTGTMTAKEDALFFSSKESGYASDYGDTVLSFKIPSTVLEVNDIFDGEVHFDIPLKRVNNQWAMNVSKYLYNPSSSMSLTEESQHPVQRGNYNVYGKDIALKKDVAPVQEVVAENTTTTQDDFAPMTEAQANERDEQQYENFYSLEENEPWDSEEPWENFAPTTYTASVDSPFDEKDIKAVGNRKVKAYMYENPEVKPFFQEEAQNMLYDLKNSVKGERYYDDNLHYQTGGDMGWSGTSRMTSPEIAYLLDSFKYTYAEIEKGLNAIIEDHGAENNAVSKRIEFLIDERLREGYKHFLYGDEIPPNQGYINLLTEKQITEYNDEAFNRWASTLTDADVQDIAPLPETVEVPKAPETANVQQTAQPEVTEAAPESSVYEGKDGQMSMFETEADKKEQENEAYHKSRKELKRALIEDSKDFFTDAMDSAKNVPAPLLNNTNTVRVTELVFGRENAKVINDTIFQRAIDNESKSIAWQNAQRKEIKALKIKPHSKESAAVQKYGEKQYEDGSGNMIPYGDAELAREFPDVATQNKIKNAAAVLRQKYDAYIDDANVVLTSLGFKPIAKRPDYMRHFEALTDAFSRIGIPFNVQQMKEYDLPTDINGLTDMFVPQKNFFANAMKRKGNKTTLDAITGIDGYIGGISNLIFHTEDIQRGRAFEDLIRENYGLSEAEKVLNAIGDDAARQKRREQMVSNHLSGYASWVHDWTDNLAGKKDIMDRGPERRFSRRVFSALDTIRKQTGANMIGGNISSSLTNLIAPVKALAKTDKIAYARGLVDTFRNIAKKDGFIDENSFLTARMGTNKLSKTLWEKWQDAGFVFMQGIDYFSSNLIVRSKYHELISKGLSSEQAHKEAGEFAARIMGDRTKGAMPQFYNSKLFNVVAQFQLEVNNDLYSMFYDTYHESKEKANGSALKTAAGMTFTLGQMVAFTHLFSEAFKSIAGYNPTLDFVEIFKTLLGAGDDDEEEKPLEDRIQEATMQLAKGLPYISTFVDGGRIPIASSIPNLIGVATGGKDDYGNELTFEDEMKKLLYLLPPTGGNQIKKTTQGLGMFDDDLPIAGSYTDSGNLRFTVEDTLQNRVQAGVFGQWASDEARDYFDNERNPLKEKQIQELVDLDLPIREYWDYREGLAEQKTLEDKFDYIAGLDVSVEQKNIMINNVVDRKEAVDMSNYDDFADYEEFDFYTKNTEKYNFLEENGVSYKDYISSEDAKKEYDSAYSWYKNNPEKVTVSKAITDNVIEYRRYTSELNDILADKDEDGDSISGSAKAKKAAYINQLNLDYGQKIILFRTYYDSKEDKSTYNGEIVEYLNGRDDISYEEMVTILKELDMKVYSDGRVEW